MAAAQTAKARKTKKCIECEKEMPSRARKCKECGALQTAKPSRSWKSLWTKLSKWWMKLTKSTKRRLVAITVALGAVAAAVPQIDTISNFVNDNFRPSHTQITVLSSANGDEINVVVTNSGFRGSTLIAYQLKFLGIPIEARDLRPIEEDGTKSIIAKQTSAMIRLTAAGLRPDIKNRERPERFTKDEITSRIAQGQAELNVVVQESNGLQTRSSGPFPAKHIAAFIKAKVPKL